MKANNFKLKISLCDQLNPHQLESLVRVVTETGGIEQNLGNKDHSGILHRMASLQDENHRIRLVYTPKPSSWLN